MGTLIVTDLSALCMIRRTRRAYHALPWDPVGRVEQRNALKDCVPNEDQIDLAHLSLFGAWDNGEGEELHVMVGDQASRRARSQLSCHIQGAPLPSHALLRVERDLYCVSPAFAALIYARGRTLSEVLMLLMELLGTYTLPPQATLPIAFGERWPAEVRDDAVEQIHYRCDPAVTLKELRALSAWAKSSEHAVFRQAVRIAAEKSASPGESIMFGMFGPPMKYGALGISSFPKGGMLLNHRVEFDHQAVLMASGMPYAICDADVPAAKTDLEYNGVGHELENTRIHDGERNNGLKGIGMKVVVINRGQMRDIVALEAIAQTLYEDAGIRYRCRVQGFRKRQAAMLNGLRRGCGLPPV